MRKKAAQPISNLVTEVPLANFLQGNVAFMQNGPWQVVNVRKAPFDWDIEPFPAGPAGGRPRVSGASFAIPSGVGGDELGLAWQLLKTLTSTGALDIYARAGRHNPARRSAGSAFSRHPRTSASCRTSSRAASRAPADTRSTSPPTGTGSGTCSARTCRAYTGPVCLTGQYSGPSVPTEERLRADLAAARAAAEAAARPAGEGAG